MFHLSWGLWALVMLGVTQLIIALVTVYFHRAMAHRAVDLSPRVRRTARFLSWFLIGMDPLEFAAVHRKHHAHCDTDQDPHSPVRFGWHGVLLRGLALYKREAANPETLQKYGQGLPVDPWDGFYRRHSNLGFLIQGILWTAVFGGQGLLAWGLILLWIPFWAAGVVNGLGHAVGYRRFETDDLSTNLVPWGLWIGGEELHNNHHADPASAKFSRAWYEVDLGWGLIRVLEACGGATVRTPPPAASPLADLLRRRYSWLRDFRHAVGQDVAGDLRVYGFRRWSRLVRASQSARHRLQVRSQQALAHPRLAAVHRLEERLRDLWRHRQRPEHLQQAFEHWLAEARALELPRLNAWCGRLGAPAPLAA
jgi:stearoyl-CoA desaturase (delta-9 desaturase)